MPDHVRTQIRHTVRDILAAQLPSGYVVPSASRKAARNATILATVDITASNDQTEQRQVQGNVLDRTLSLYVRVGRIATGDALDDLLDQDEVRVHNIIMSHDWSMLLADEPVPMQTNFSTSGDGEKDTGVLVTRFDFLYRVSTDDLTVAII
jgi:hypothetical protein